MTITFNKFGHLGNLWQDTGYGKKLIDRKYMTIIQQHIIKCIMLQNSVELQMSSVMILSSMQNTGNTIFHDKDSLLYITGDQIWTFLSFRGLISDFVLSAHLKKTKYTFSYYLTNIVLVSCVLFIYFF